MYVILNFRALDFLVHLIKEREFQKTFCHYLPYFYTDPGWEESNQTLAYPQLIKLAKRLEMASQFVIRTKTSSTEFQASINSKF